MNGLRITNKDNEKVELYMELTGAIVTVRGGRWLISTPEENLYFETTAMLMDTINYNLELSKEHYIQNGELAEWDAAVERAANRKKKPYREIRAERMGLSQTD